MTVVEIIELGNPEQAPEVKVGDIATLAWMMDNETGKGFFKGSNQTHLYVSECKELQ